MYAPWVAGFQISPPESGPVPDWALVLYYSGYSAVTLGVGDAFSALRYSSCIAVEAEGQVLLKLRQIQAH